MPELINKYTAAIGNSLGDDSIFGFIDGTEVHICRSSKGNQELFYSGHHKHHACGHSAIILLNGLFGAIFSSLPASSGDATLCIQVKFSNRLKELLSYLPANEARFVYSNAAFNLQDYILNPYKKSRNRTLTPSQQALNQWLSTKIIMVEHGFRGVKSTFTLLS